MERSTSLKEISQALLEFHKMEISIKKDAKNPFYHNSYATLSNIIKATKSKLAECGLTVIQLPREGYKLETILLHSSGEYISEVYDMKPVKTDPQGQGSAITYQRRYALGAVLNLDIDDDDDGNGVSKPDQKQPEKRPAEKMPITDKQFTQLIDRIKAAKQPKEAGEQLFKARKVFTFTEDQESVIKEWEDNRNA